MMARVKESRKHVTLSFDKVVGGFFKGEIHVEPRPSLPATKAIGDRLAFRIDFPLSLIPLAVVVLQWHG